MISILGVQGLLQWVDRRDYDTNILYYTVSYMCVCVLLRYVTNYQNSKQVSESPSQRVLPENFKHGTSQKISQWLARCILAWVFGWNWHMLAWPFSRLLHDFDVGMIWRSLVIFSGYFGHDVGKFAAIQLSNNFQESNSQASGDS